jgi:hypothetical protein
MPHLSSRLRSNDTAAVVSIALLALTFGACSSVEDNKTPLDACDAYAATVGDMTRTCFRSSIVQRVASIEDEARAQCNSLITLDGSSVTGAFFLACAGALRGAPCLPTGPLPACEAPAGTRDDGAPCVAPVQCRSLFCKQRGSGCGVCAPRAELGDVCSTDQWCVGGAHCDGATMTCVPLVISASGGPCSESGQQCEPGTFCNVGACQPPAQAGESCETVQCAQWMRCDPNGRTCYLPEVAGEGQPCGSGAKAVCGPGLICGDKPETCVRMKLIEPGGDCGRDYSVCRQGECQTDELGARRCPTVIAEGGACPTDWSADCAVGAMCVDGQCRSLQHIVCE